MHRRLEKLYKTVVENLKGRDLLYSFITVLYILTSKFLDRVPQGDSE
jgi:hypothetical protein